MTNIQLISNAIITKEFIDFKIRLMKKISGGIGISTQS
jgi:hypothetical protein